MKIIFEETEHETFKVYGKRKVEIEWSSDDMTIWEFREKLLEPALLAWTYGEETIAELFNEKDEKDEEDEDD